MQVNEMKGMWHLGSVCTMTGNVLTAHRNGKNE